MSYKRKNDFKCELCGYTCGNGYLLSHIKRKHNLKKEEYLILYPNAKFYTDDFLLKRSENTRKQMLKRWEDEKYREKMCTILTNNSRNPEVRKAIVESRNKSEKRFHTDEYKKQESERMKRMWEDEIYRKNVMMGIMNSPKRFKSEITKRKISNSITNLWENGHYERYNQNSYSFGRRYIYINKNSDELHLKSLQELRVAYYLDLSDCNYIYGMDKIQKFKYKINDKAHYYYPDFQINDFFIEVKPNNWEINKDVYNKIKAVCNQNKIMLVIYDDIILEEFLPFISRDGFYNICENNIKNGKLNYVDLYKSIGDVRSKILIEMGVVIKNELQTKI